MVCAHDAAFYRSRKWRGKAMAGFVREPGTRRSKRLGFGICKMCARVT
jgi:hypothetical protein